jgi:hypothetical protein
VWILSIIRAAADASGRDDIVIIGSAAVLGQFPDAPEAMQLTPEADVFPRDAPELAGLIDGSLGELSAFHDSFGYYAHGVGPETARAPAGWEQRLVPIRNENTRGKTGWCVEIHDLVLAKCVAGREKDWRFADEAVAAGLVELKTLFARTEHLPLPPAACGKVLAALRARYDH